MKRALTRAFASSSSPSPKLPSHSTRSTSVIHRTPDLRLLRRSLVHMDRKEDKHDLSYNEHGIENILENFKTQLESFTTHAADMEPIEPRRPSAETSTTKPPTFTTPKPPSPKLTQDSSLSKLTSALSLSPEPPAKPILDQGRVDKPVTPQEIGNQHQGTSVIAEDPALHTCSVAMIDQAPNSFYRRPLPDALIAFSSTEGKKLFREAMEQGYMEGYFALAEQFVSQSEPAYCGPATLSMCLNALNIDPNRLWKGPWRWFAEDMLDCCTPLEVVRKRGITFTEFACLARCNGASVTSVRGDESTLEGFRNAIKEATSQEALHLVVSYSRQVLGQTGQGHYSPVGGYHPGKDLALVLDVARFKYAPHWVPIETLWRSMHELDQDTKKPRGYYLLTRSKDHRPPAVCRITSRTMWAAVAAHLSSDTPAPTQNAYQLVEQIVKQLPPEASQVLRTYPEDLHGRLPREHADMQKKFFEEISTTEMCTIVREVLTHMENTPFHTQYGPEILCVLLLAVPSQLFGTLDLEIRDVLARVRSLEPLSTDVQSEIMQIREQMLLALKSTCKQCKIKNQGQNPGQPHKHNCKSHKGEAQQECK